MEPKFLLLERVGGTTWTFEYVYEKKQWLYYSNAKVYRLFFQDPQTHVRPFWVGSLTVDDRGRGSFWFDCTKEIGALRIKFKGSCLYFEEKK